MRVVPHETVPPEVYKHLLPHEQQVITIRKHPAVLLMPGGLLGASAVASGLMTAVRRKTESADPAPVWGAWGISGVLLAVAALRAAAWLQRYDVVTDSRMMQVNGLVTTRVQQVPLSQLADMELRRSWAGRLLGYGTFVITTPHGVRKIRFLPYPEQVYLEVCGLIYKDPGNDKA